MSSSVGPIPAYHQPAWILFETLALLCTPNSLGCCRCSYLPSGSVASCKKRSTIPDFSGQSPFCWGPNPRNRRISLIVKFKILGSDHHLEVSINGDTSKSSILMEFSTIKRPFYGFPIYGNPHLLLFFNPEATFASTLAGRTQTWGFPVGLGSFINQKAIHLLVGGLVAIFYFPISIGNNHPNWLIFFRGVAEPPTRLRLDIASWG